MKTRLFIIFIFFTMFVGLCLRITPESFAQISFGGSGAIDIKAKKASYKGNKTTLFNNVVVKQKGVIINADKMIIIRSQKTNSVEGLIKLGNIDRIIATGHFKYNTADTSISGDKGVYERDKNIITITGNAIYTQGNNKVTGNRMIFDLTTNKARVDGSCVGRNCQNNKRVHISIGEQRR